jgi:hypothetical protein
MNVTPPLVAALLFSGAAFAAQNILPEPLPASRYEKMLDASPFALATKTEAPVDKGPGPFANLYVAGFYQLKDKDTGKLQDFVTLKSRADNSTFTLTGSEPGKDDLQLVSIELSDKVGASKVMLKKGNEFGPITFDQANLQPAPQQQIIPRTGPGGVPVPGVPGANPRTGVRLPVVPRPTTVAPVPNQPAPQLNTPQGAAQPQAAPRRVRVINSKQP